MKNFDSLFSKFSKLGEKDLLRLNEAAGWSLNASELLSVRKYYAGKKREPTRGELETIAQTWSEHCKHKTFSGPVEFRRGKKTKKYKNLFKETIVKTTKSLNRPWCLSVFEDNAGVMEISPKSPWAAAFKAETHNHPCALEPQGGAETGVGGVIRDILGVGLGAKPVLNTDVFCFARPDSGIPLPKHALPPKRIFSKVVEGVRDYGNRMGIPTAAGAIYFDDDYALNPLVYVGCAGIIPKSKIRKKVRKGDLIMAVGGRTGRDGIHGATFSSANIDEKSPSSAVQIGHPLNEKKMLDALMKARDMNLYNAVTDCGAGGFSSAVGELAMETGAKVFLEKVKLKDSRAGAWEIWVSESQERMVLSVPRGKAEKLKKILKAHDCEYSVIGKFTGDKKLVVSFKGKEIINLDSSFLHHELPKNEKIAEYEKPKADKTPPKKSRLGFPVLLKKILAHHNVCSRRSVVRQYDFEVQGGTVLKPLVGTESAPSDAAVIWPHSATGNMNDFSGFAVSHGFNPLIGKYDPSAMAAEAADEAVRNLLCAGANIEKTALMDNFCAGDPSDKKAMGQFVLAAEALCEAAMAFKAPFISGKDSFYNQSKDASGRQKSIPLSLLVSAMAPVEDVRKCLTANFKSEGNPVYAAGETKKGMGASVCNEIEFSGNTFFPPPGLKTAAALYKVLRRCVKKGLVASAHDVSQGGFLASLSEMTFSSGLGVTADISKMPAERGAGDIEKLFGESPSRVILEVRAEKEKEFLKVTAGHKVRKIGRVTAERRVKIADGGKILLNESAEELSRTWNRDLL